MLLNRQELCEAFGVSDSAIGAWEKKGMPVVRRGRGRGQKSIYNFDQVKAWRDRTGLGSGVQALVARLSAGMPTVPPAFASTPAGAIENAAGRSAVDRDVAAAIALARVDTFSSYAEDPAAKGAVSASRSDGGDRCNFEARVQTSARGDLPPTAECPAQEIAEAIDMFIYFLGTRLAKIRMLGVSRILDCSFSEEAFKGGWPELLARAKSEVPAEPVRVDDV